MKLSVTLARSGLFSALLVLGACGGGGGGGGGAGGGETAVNLFFSSGLGMVDPGTPATPTYVEPAGSATEAVSAVTHGNYNSGTRSFSNLHHRSVFYFKDGKLWKVNALKGAAATPVQVTSTSGVPEICDKTAVGSNFANHDHARILVSVPGADTNCGTSDDVWGMLRIDDNTATPVVSLGTMKPVKELHDVANGSLSGWLIWKSNKLHRINPDFASSATILDPVASADYVAQANDGRVFLKLDSELRLYDPNSNFLSASLHTFSSNFGSADNDGQDLYFSDGNTIYRLPLDGTSSSTSVVSIVGETLYSPIRVTPSHLIYIRSQAGGGRVLRARPKTGGASVTLKSVPSGSITLVTTAQHRVYFNVTAAGDIGPSASGSVRDDNTGLVEYSGIWSGYSEPTERKLGREKLARDVFLLDTSTTPAKLKSFDAASHSLKATLGDVPAGFGLIAPMGLTNNNHMLALGMSGGSTDIFYLNTNVSGSLTRVTDTPGIEEHVVGGCSLKRGAAFDPLFGLMILGAIGYWLRRRLG